MKINYDNDGNILGFYNEDVHGDNIPTPNKNISVEVWQYLLANQNKKIKIASLNKEELIEDDFEDKPIVIIPQVPTLEEKNRSDIDYILIMQGL